MSKCTQINKGSNFDNIQKNGLFDHSLGVNLQQLLKEHLHQNQLEGAVLQV